jgi:hypothetical protein
MDCIDDYLQRLDLPHTYEIDGEEKPLEEFDGVAVSVETGDEEFLGWTLRRENDREYVVLSQDTPGLVEELKLEELEEKLESGEYMPTLRTETGYRKAEYR